MIQHLILLRSDYSGRDDAFIDRRRLLTERYCKPSLSAQTRKDFTVVWCGREPSWADVEPHLLPDTTHVLTTRTDDDDALALDFVERLRGAVSDNVSDKPTLYLFPNGFTTDGRRCGLKHNPPNQYLSLMSHVSEKLTCYEHEHRKMMDHFPTVTVCWLPAWLFVRHGDTLSEINGNRRRYRMDRPLGRVARLFGIRDQAVC